MDKSRENKQEDYAPVIKELRERTGLSQSKFAAYFEMPTRTLQCWETGERKPPAYVVSMMQRILGSGQDPVAEKYRLEAGEHN